MRYTLIPRDRRSVLRLGAGIAGGALLSGCGGDSLAEADSSTSAALRIATAPNPSDSAAEAVEKAHGLNLALNLGYVGALYYGVAARGAGLADSATAGIGTPGAGYGARQMRFTDPIIALHVSEFADDKAAQVLALRSQLGAQAAAQPAIDLSATGAFSKAAQGAGIVPAGAGFDPYASDGAFLIGAFLIENRVAAGYRTLLGTSGDTAAAEVIASNLADAIYHGGVIRSLLEDAAATDPVAASALTNVGTFLAALDGTNVGDQTLAGASGPSADIDDADGHPIAFTRDTAQVLKAFYLSTGSVGGFLPNGANGIHV